MSLRTKLVTGGVLLAATAIGVVLWRRDRTPAAAPDAVRPTAPIDEIELAIELEDDYDVTFWMRRLGVSKADLEAAVRDVGPTVTKVQAYLSRAVAA